MVVDILANDNSGSAPDPATVKLTGTGTLSPDGKTLTSLEGVWSVDNAGILTFTPASGYTGAPPAVGYTVEDAEGNISEISTVTPTLAVVTAPDIALYIPGLPVTVNILANDNTGGTPDPPACNSQERALYLSREKR